MRYSVKPYLLVVFVLVGVPSLFAQRPAMYKKHVGREVDAAHLAYLFVEHKHGDIEVHSTSDDKISIAATIASLTTNQAVAEEMVNGVQFSIIQSGDSVLIATTFNGVHDQSYALKKGDNIVQVDIDLFVPSDMVLTLGQRFGDVVISQFDGPLNIQIKDGNLKAGQLPYLNHLGLHFASGVILATDRIKANLYNAQLTVLKSTDLELNSSFSEIVLGSLDQLHGQSKHDKFKIESVNKLNVSGGFADFNIETVSESLVTNFLHSDVRCETVLPTIKIIDVKGRYSDYRLRMDPRCVFSLDAELVNANCLMDNTFHFEEKEITQQEKRTVIKATSSQSSATKVVVNCSNGVVNFGR